MLPSFYHLLILSNAILIDSMTRSMVRKRLSLPQAVTIAYFNANYRDGGSSIFAMRWLMLLQWKEKLEKLTKGGQTINFYLSRKSKEPFNGSQSGKTYNYMLDRRWRKLLHSSINGRSLKDSRKTLEQHQWISYGNRLLLATVN